MRITRCRSGEPRILARWDREDPVYSFQVAEFRQAALFADEYQDIFWLKLGTLVRVDDQLIPTQDQHHVNLIWLAGLDALAHQRRGILISIRL